MSTRSVSLVLRAFVPALLAVAGPAFAQQSEAPTDPPPGASVPASPAPASPAPVPHLVAGLPPPPPASDDLPIPTLTLDRVPPNTSFEFAVQVSFGQVAYFRDQVPPWVGFGLRGGWGKNFGVHRFGIAGTLTAEGDIGVHTQLGIEPAAAWDVVSSHGLLLGASVGPAIVFSARTSTIDPEYGFDIAPSVAARVGWSQTWSRVGRRLFLFVEPKARMVDGEVSPLVAVAVGSGGGR